MTESKIVGLFDFPVYYIDSKFLPVPRKSVLNVVWGHHSYPPLRVLLDVLVEQAAPQYALNAVTLILTMIAGHDHTLVQQNISLLVSG